MNVQRFTAATSREALAKARQAFGEGTLILSNRPTANGVEVVATAEDSLATLDAAVSRTAARSGGSSQQRQQPPSYREVASKVEEDAEQLAMSTLSFQDYVRERMLRRRAEAQQIPVLQPEVTSMPMPAPAPVPLERPQPTLTQRIAIDIESQHKRAAPVRQAAPAPSKSNCVAAVCRKS